MLMGSQTNDFVQTKGKWGSLIYMLFLVILFPINCYSVMSAVRDVYNHPEVTTKDSSPNVNVTSTMNTTLTTTLHLCKAEAVETAESCELHVSTLFNKAVPIH